MSDLVVSCGGARVKKSDLVLRLTPPRANVSLRVGGLAPAGRIPPAFVDLVELAAYIDSIPPASARRNVRVVMPFRAADAFRDPAVFVPLQRTLNVLTGDTYRIDVQPRRTARDPGERAWIEDGDDASWPRGPLDVVPFSGGLDSFAGALRLVRSGRRVVLVAQRSSPRIEPYVAKLARALIDEAEGRAVFVPIWHRSEPRGRETGFLFSAVSAAIAATSPGSAVRFFENGVVSLGLPLSASGLASRAARPAHPRVLSSLAQLFSALLVNRARKRGDTHKIPVDNGFLFTTKAEVVRGIEADRGEPWIATTVSCTKRAPRPHTHCGLCAQCIDRRFATLGAGARVHDPSTLYAVDLLTGERPAGEPRAIVEAYVRAANEIARATDHEIFTEHGELARVLSYLPGRVDAAAAKVIDLHRRHAAEVEEVLDAGIREHASALRRGTLPRSSVLMLSLPSELEERSPGTIRIRAPRRAKPGVVRILHLSDLHFSKRRAWDQDPVLSALARDVTRLREDGLRADLVALTGDVADRGTPDEYALAATFLRDRLFPAADVDASRLLLVPGNHDVDRAAVKRVAQATQADLLRAESQDAIAAIFADAAERAPLLRRHDAWIAFVRGLGAAHAELPWWSQRLTIGALTLHVAGLCTSWASWCDDDKGRLLLGRVQLHEVLEGAERADLAIALMHHPWDYLADFDAAEAREAVHRRCDVLLRGHLHRGDGAARIRPDGGSLELAAGASWGGTQHLHGYQLIELEPEKSEARVYLRTWDGHDWIPDRNAYRGAAPDGVARFPLRARV